MAKKPKLAMLKGGEGGPSTRRGPPQPVLVEPGAPHLLSLTRAGLEAVYEMARDARSRGTLHSQLLFEAVGALAVSSGIACPEHPGERVDNTSGAGYRDQFTGELWPAPPGRCWRCAAVMAQSHHCACGGIIAIKQGENRPTRCARCELEHVYPALKAGCATVEEQRSAALFVGPLLDRVANDGERLRHVGAAEGYFEAEERKRAERPAEGT